MKAQRTLPASLPEDLGWRGSMQEHLLHSHEPFQAALIVGIFHASWHLPLSSSQALADKPRGTLKFELHTFFTVAGALTIALIWTRGRTFPRVRIELLRTP